VQEQDEKVVRERILKVILTSDARQRLTNINMVKPDVAKRIEDTIIQLASTGKLKQAVTDEEIKNYLNAMQEPKREFKIRRI
jgi:programmed cell death protein 5|tara:strand:+ start:603 stop:848 length:246 start_codon:yes stop_codon:yes gene_type:complete